MNRHVPGQLRNAGFSLIEVLIVLAGVGLIAGLIVPGLTQMLNNYNTAFAAQEISTQLHFAKLKAISGNEAIRVDFPDANSYKVELSDGTVLRGPYFYPKDIGVNTAEGGVQFPGNFVTFQPDGTVPAAGNGSAGRVKLISRTGLRVDIIVGSDGLIRQTPPYHNASPPF